MADYAKAEYALKEGEVEAKQLHPATCNAEQMAMWTGGIANGVTAYATCTLRDGAVAKIGDWVARKADGSYVVEACTGPLEGYEPPEPAPTTGTEGAYPEPAPAADPPADPPVGTTYTPPA